MLFKLSLKNITKSMKDYAIYFFTLILGVAIFYIFNSIESQTVMLNVSESTHSIITTMNQVLSGVSVFVSFVLAFLIIYASRFLIKRRKKEFGIYMTLGMSKGKISKVLLFETILIGLISLLVGLGIGIFLSQLMSVFVARMFEADMTEFTFIFSLSALLKTILYFGIMYIVVMVLNTIQVSRCKLIDLLSASKVSEKVKLKNPWICAIIFIIASSMLGYAYYQVIYHPTSIGDMGSLCVLMIIGSLATFLVNWSLSGLILKIVMSLKKTYYKGLNSFILRQINSKINTTVCSMTVICLMLFLTICILSSALSMKNSMTSSMKELTPVDIQIKKDYHPDPSKYSTEVMKDASLTLIESLNKTDFSTEKELKDMITFDLYTDPNLTIGTFLGDHKEKVQKKYPFLYLDSKEDIIRLSDYNQLAKLYGLKTYELKEDQFIVVADYENMVTIRNQALHLNDTIIVNGKTYHARYQTCQDGFIEMSANHVNSGFIVVPDDAVNDTMKESNILVANYNSDTEEGKKAIEAKFSAIENHPYSKHIKLSGATKLLIYETSIGLGAMVTFIGIYLGIIFLITSAAILALKELSESADNKYRYQMLRKIGADEKMIRHALFSQIAIFFLFPLILAIIHSIVGIQLANYILATIGNLKLLSSIIMTTIFLTLIYGGYFLLTYYCSREMIKEK